MYQSTSFKRLCRYGEGKKRNRLIRIRSQPICLEVVVSVVFAVVVVFDIYFVKIILFVDRRLLLMEVEFGWWWVLGWCANPFSCQTQLS